MADPEKQVPAPEAEATADAKQTSAQKPRATPDKRSEQTAEKTGQTLKQSDSDDVAAAKGDEPQKRQKVGAGEGKTTAAEENKEEAKDGAVVPDDSEDFSEADQQEGQDSFDEDFDGEEEEPHGDDDEFDLEAYLKWRKENPDAEEPEKDATAKPGAELPEDDEDDYDEEDD